MNERVLCKGELQVAVGGGGSRTMIEVKNGQTVGFWTRTSEMEEILLGDPVQLSSDGGYCRIEVSGDMVHLEFGLKAKQSGSCSFPVSELRAALAAIRGRPTPKA